MLTENNDYEQFEQCMLQPVNFLEEYCILDHVAWHENLLPEIVDVQTRMLNESDRIWSM